MSFCPLVAGAGRALMASGVLVLLFVAYELWGAGLQEARAQRDLRADLEADLKKGPGHYPGTPLPGQPGNSGIAGHRTTYGAPFSELQRLEAGDDILVTTRQGQFRYEVDRTVVVRPDQVEVLDPTEEARLTLTTCTPASAPGSASSSPGCWPVTPRPPPPRARRRSPPGR